MSPRRKTSITSDAVAFVYARISLARDDLATKRQVDACKQLCAARGWKVAGVYVDESVSAYSGKTRPEFERMVQDAAAHGGELVIVSWDLDRLVRRVREVGRLIDLYTEHHVPFVTVTGGVDMTSAAGKLIATILTAVAEMESEHKAERLRARFEQEREAGRPHWIFRPFGFELGGAHRDDEAELLRQMYDWVNRGDTLAAIVKRLHELDVRQPERTMKGVTQAKPFTTNALRDLLRAERNVGLLRSKTDGSVRPGAWEAIVDVETFDRAQQMLDGLVARYDLTRKHEYLLRSHVICGTCGKLMYAQPRTQRGVQRNLYLCRKYAATGQDGCGMSVTVERVDAIVRDHVLDVLDDPKNRERIVTHDDANGDAAALLDTISETQRAREQLVELIGDGLISQSDARAKLEALNERAERARAKLARTASSSTIVELPDDLRAGWDALPLATRRTIVQGVIEPVVIGPCVKAGRIFDESRVRIVDRHAAKTTKTKAKRAS